MLIVEKEVECVDYIVVDLETTGLNSEDSEIIEIGAVRICDGQATDEFQRLVRPAASLSLEVINLTGIDDIMLADAPFWEDVCGEFLAWCGSKPVLIAHNALFEQAFLRDFLPNNWQWLDTLVLAKIVRPTLASYSLQSLLRSYELKNARPHRALEDAQATALLFLAILADFAKLPLATWANIAMLTAGGKDAVAQLFFTEAQKVLLKNFGKVDVKNGLQLPKFKEEKPAKTSKKEENWQYQLPLEKLEEYFDRNGVIAKAMPAYQIREPQQLMAKKVAEAFNRQHFLVVEAGTGTGKSLAYLLSAVLFAMGSKIPVAISTHTKNLQKQLWDKDLPELAEILGKEISAALLKGRGNYLCLRKWQDATELADADSLPFLLRLAVWLGESETGDVSEMNIIGADKEIWQYLAAYGENCTAPNCPYSKGACFITKMRRKAEKADILILNHSLLLADGVLAPHGGGILPQFGYLVIDEAHHLAGVAEDQYTCLVSLGQLNQAVARLYRKEKKKKAVGSLVAGQVLFAAGHKKTQELQQLIEELQEAAEKFFVLSGQLLGPEIPKLGGELRITKQRKESYWAVLEDAISNFIFLLQKTGKASTDLLENLTSFSETTQKPLLQVLAADLQMAVIRLGGLAQVAQKIVDCDDPQWVIWVRQVFYEEYPTWCIAPLGVGEVLVERLYYGKNSIIFTSATLSTQGNFVFFENSVGLNLIENELKELLLPAPFDYAKQALCGVATDLPNFSKSSDENSLLALAKALPPLIEAAKGRSLVLFTSHQQLRGVYNLIKQELAECGIEVLAQGISGSREILLEALRENNVATCVLGASSFWEGIDVAGEALSLVVLVRLPFWPPTAPIVAARLEQFAMEGKDGFFDYSLPQAIIRFKQGFGRLIRTAEDKGVFCVLDRRIFEKNYGKYFSASLPDLEICYAPSFELAYKIQFWLD